MRKRAEVEQWVKSKQSPDDDLEQLRLQAVVIELLLDIRDLLSSLDSAAFDIDNRNRDTLR